MPKVPRPSALGGQRHNPLAEDYSPSNPFKTKAPKKRKSRDEDAEGDVVVDAKASERILRIGRELADEEETERKARYTTAPNPAFEFDSRLGGLEEDEEAQSGTGYDDDDGWGDEEEVVELEV
jgi:essential nuclear protein 1